ncbi:MAG TPA: PAS domain S-box protein [Oculatellaceae cyanobacterium]|jgi:PAS domain S-box-containing protein
MATIIRKQATTLIGLIGLLMVFILPFTGVVYQLISEIDYQINFAKQELYGDAYLPPLWKMLEHIPQHELLAHDYLSKEISAVELLNTEAQIEQDFQDLAKVEAELGKVLKTRTKYEGLKHNWQSIKEQLPIFQKNTVNDLYMQILHNQLIAELRNFITTVGNSSNLILDPDLDSYYLMDTILLKLPDTQDKLTKIAFLNQDIIERHQVSLEEKAEIIILSGLVASNQEAIAKGITIAFQHNLSQKLQPVLEKPLQQSADAITTFLENLNQKIIKTNNLNDQILTASLFPAQAITTNSKFWYYTIYELDELLQARINKLARKKYFVEAFALFVLVISLYVFVAFIRNLIKRKQTEVALQEAENKYRSIVENSPDGIFQTTPEGTYISVNPALARIYGYSSEEELTARISDIQKQLYVNPNRRTEFQQLMDNYDLVSEFESQIYRADGSIVWISEDARAARDEQGKLLYYEGTVKDITERKQSEEALRQSEERFRSLISNIPSAVYRYRVDSDWTMEFISNVVTEITGYPASDFIENKVRTFSSLIHSEDQKIVKQAIQQSIEDKQPYVVEYRIYRTADKTLRWVCDKGQAIFDDNGNVLWLDGAIFDVTDRKEEEALRQSEARFRKQAQQLEQALSKLQQTQTQLIQTEKMSGLGQMVAGVAHEINNPVNFIHGNLSHASQYMEDLLNLVYLYQQHYPDPAPAIADEIEAIDLQFLVDDLPKILASMKIGTNRIREIVLSLRNFSRLDEADMKLVDIHEGIDSTLLILQNRLKPKGGQPPIQLIKEYGDLPKIECYAGQLNQVFMNILTNAIDVLDEDNHQRSIEEIKQQPSIITIRTNVCNDDFVVVRIANNGPAMPEDVKKRVFDPFFTTKEVGKGTGLGLSISYSIVVEKHQGSIYCESMPEQGTEFFIKIPVLQSKVVEKTQELVTVAI